MHRCPLAETAPCPCGSATRTCSHSRASGPASWCRPPSSLAQVGCACCGGWWNRAPCCGSTVRQPGPACQFAEQSLPVCGASGSRPRVPTPLPPAAPTLLALAAELWHGLAGQQDASAAADLTCQPGLLSTSGRRPPGMARRVSSDPDAGSLERAGSRAGGAAGAAGAGGGPGRSSFDAGSSGAEREGSGHSVLLMGVASDGRVWQWQLPLLRGILPEGKPAVVPPAPKPELLGGWRLVHVVAGPKPAWHSVRPGWHAPPGGPPTHASELLQLHPCPALPRKPATRPRSPNPPAGLMHTLPQRATAFSASPAPVPLPGAHGAVTPLAAATAAGGLAWCSCGRDLFDIHI